MKKETDFEYINQGLFVSIMPVTPQAIIEWGKIDYLGRGTGKVLRVHFDSLRIQLRWAGYTLRKAKPVTISDDDLLAALGI